MKEKNKNNYEAQGKNPGKFLQGVETYFFGVLAIFLVIIIAQFIDSGLLWSMQSIKFLPVFYPLLFIILILFAFVPYLSNFYIKPIEWADDYLKNNHKVINYILALLLSFLMLYLLRVRVPLLGDSYVLLHNMFRGGDFGHPIKEYLLTYFFVFLVETFREWGPKSTVWIYSSVSIFSGLLFLFIIHKIARNLTKDRIERAAIIGFSFFTGSGLLFFGYIENYPIIYALNTLFFYFAFRVIKEKKPFFAAFILFLVLMATHYASVMLFPVLLYLIYVRFGKRKFIILTVLLILSAVFVYLAMYYSDSRKMLLNVQKDILNNLMILEGKKESSLWAYDFFSWYHLIDYLNLFIIINPLLVLALILYFEKRNKNKIFSSELLMLIIGIGSLLMIALMVNYPYGASKDWDIIACYSLPINLFVPLAIIKTVKHNKSRKYFYILGFTIIFIHSISYILVYAHEESAIERTKSLYDPRIMPLNGGAFIYINIANYYNYLGRIDKEVEVLEDALLKFPKSTRLYGIVSDVYLTQLKNDSAAYRILTLAYQNGAINTKMIQNLGILAVKRNEPDLAIKYWDESLVKGGENFESLFNIAFTYQNRNMLDKAILYYLRAEKLRSGDVTVLINLGNCYAMQRNYELAVGKYKQFINLYPAHPMAKEIEGRIKSIEILRKN